MKVWMPLIRTRTGAEVYARRLAEGLADRGHEVELDLVSHGFQYAPWLAPIRMPPDTDVIFANSWTAAAFARRGVPLVTVFHHCVHDPAQNPYKSPAQKLFHDRFVRPMELNALRRSAVNIAISRFTADAVARYLDSAPMTVVLNGIDTDFWHSGSEPPEEGPLRLLFVGKPSLRKGFDLVAEIAGRLADVATLTCVSDPPAAPLPRPKARYTGRIDDDALRTEYQTADFLLFPSRLEGFGYVAAEAMACGLPVIGCTGTVIEEIAPPTTGSILCSPGDIDAFVTAIRAAASAPKERARHRFAARQHAVRNFDVQRWLDEMESALAGALHDPN